MQVIKSNSGIYRTDWSLEVIDVEKRLVRNKANILKLDQETREKLQITQKLFYDKPIMGCTYYEKGFK